MAPARGHDAGAAAEAVAHGHAHRHPAEGPHLHPHGHGLGSHGHGDSGFGHEAVPVASRMLVVAVVLTVGYGIVELFGGIWSGSLALIADAGHMGTDAASLLIALAANIVARRPASHRHSFGLARADVIAAFVNSLALLAVVVWLVIEAVGRLLSPVQVRGESVFAIASVGLVVNLIVAWLLSRESGNVNMRAALLHVIGDLLGSVAAIVAGVVIMLTGFYAIDPLLSTLVAGLILRSTLGVLRQTTLVLLDSVPEGVDYALVGEALAGIPGVLQVHDLHIWSMVPGRSALSAHMLVEDVSRWPAILRKARETLKQRFGIDHSTLQPEWLPPGSQAGERRTISLRRAD